MNLMESTYKNIVVLFVVMLIMTISWVIWEMNRSQMIIDEYTTIGKSFERAEADAESEYKLGFYNFHYTWDNAIGKTAPGNLFFFINNSFTPFLNNI